MELSGYSTKKSPRNPESKRTSFHSKKKLFQKYFISAWIMIIIYFKNHSKIIQRKGQIKSNKETNQPSQIEFDPISIQFDPE